MAHVTYYPEMGDAKPEADIEATLGHYGNHWLLKTPLFLQGRGIHHIGTLKAANLTPQAKRKAGWHMYRVTARAFERLAKKYTIADACLL